MDWGSVPPEARPARVREALEAGDLEALHALTIHHLTAWGRAGAAVSRHTLRSYRSALRGFLSWLRRRGLEGEALARAVLDPTEDLGALYLRHLEERGAKPGTVNARRAALSAFYRALIWARAATRDPFQLAPVRRDPVPRHEKRRPYEEHEVRRLLEVASPVERALVLLGAQGGLRVSEAVRLRWEDVELEAARMRVLGKGRKVATVLIPKGLKEALEALPHREGPVLPYATEAKARKALRDLAKRAGVPYRGFHALRHYCGTYLYRATKDLQTVARHLRHSQIQTTSVYAKWSEDQVRGLLDSWA